MNAVRIRRKLESDILHLPELKPLIGKNVEIIVQENDSGDPGCFSDLSAPKPLSDQETQALRELLTAEQFEALMDVARRGGPDMVAIARMRAKSMT
jgi:hypothetical protein